MRVSNHHNPYTKLVAKDNVFFLISEETLFKAGAVLHPYPPPPPPPCTMACRRRALLLTSLALMFIIRSKRGGKGKRQFWVRNIFSEYGKSKTGYVTLYPQLKENDREYYFNYLRMTPERFFSSYFHHFIHLKVLSDYKNNRKNQNSFFLR